MQEPDITGLPTSALIAELDRRARRIRDGLNDTPPRTNAVHPTVHLTITGPVGCGKTVVADEFVRFADRHGYVLTVEERQP